MTPARPITALAALFAATGAVAADLLPLKQGIYVPANHPCKGASNAEIVNYWGGKSAIGSSQGECTIRKVARNGKTYTLSDVCKDIRSGEAIEGGPTVLTIGGPAAFRMGGTAYRWCGTKVQF